MQVRRQSAIASTKNYAITDPNAEPKNILERIIWHKEREVAQMYANEPIASVKAKLATVSPPRDFYGSLLNSPVKPAIIAEVKKASPSKGVFRQDFDPVMIATAYERGGAACLSVLTDTEFFQGGFANLQQIRHAVNLPLLCKEFIIDPYQVYLGRSYGADAILLIAAILNDADLIELLALIHQLGMTALVEVHTQAELDRILQIPDVRLIGINNRNLENFFVDLGLTKILMDKLDSDTRNKYLWVSESGIYRGQDLEFVRSCGASAVLVGESLIKQDDIEKAVQNLSIPNSGKRSQNWSQLLKQLLESQNLTTEQATSLMQGWLEGAIAPELSGAILTALQFKGVTASELAAMASLLQSQSEGEKFKTQFSHIVDRSKPLIDTCGTGGDGAATFNISTAVAFVVAAAGIPVAKHGNRAVSSKSGSADVLEALGIHLAAPLEKIYEALPAVGITFLFAPHWHPAMKAVGAIRKSLGIRTIFNLIGPLVNPLHPTAQVLGVYNRSLTHTLAEALRLLGRQQAVVLHSREGMDEAGLGDLTDISFLKNGQVSEEAIAPQDLGLTSAPIARLKGGDVRENAEILRLVLQGKGDRAQTDCVALNSGLALRIAGKASTWDEGVNLGLSILQSGAAWDKAQALVNFLQ